MNGIWVLLAGWAGLVILFGLLWFVQRRTADAGIVDVGWSFAFSLVAVFYAIVLEGNVARRFLIALLSGVWSLRLGLYIFWRDHGKPENERYRQLREKWGDSFQLRLFWF